MKQLNWKYLLIEVLFLVVGLFLAMKVDEWSTNRRLNKRKNIALENIRSEIERNKEELETQGDNEDYYKILEGLVPFLIPGPESRELFVEATLAEASSLRDSFPEGLVLMDSTKGEGDTYRYTFAIEVGGFNYVQLGDIAWEATKIGNLIDRMEFECVEELLSLYKMQETFLGHQERYIELYVEENRIMLVNQFMILHQFGEALKETYEETLEIYGKCTGEKVEEQG